ncbi:MAG: AAA family ATPase [Longispora sp.]|nr:AAA family ATPase [Longispora sp. (in: high G+C Gram-positive bacteria)]
MKSSPLRERTSDATEKIFSKVSKKDYLHYLKRQFVGRAPELQSLEACALKAREGTPCLVLLQGEAGIGKTALIRHFVAGLKNFTVLRAIGDRTEVDYPFGIVTQLAARVPSKTLTKYPLLEGHMAPGAPAVQVGGQLLELLGSLQDSGPVAIVVDEMEWADTLSVQALGFVLRRLWADRVLIILVSRSGTAGGDEEAWRRLAAGDITVVELSIDGLETPDVAQLIKLSSHSTLSSDVVARLQAHTGGHPLYLQGLLADLPVDTLADVTMELPVPATLVLAIQQQLGGLSHQSRRLLDALAVIDARSPLSVAAAIAGVEDATVALQPVVAIGLVDWWPAEPSTPVVIHHQLQRQAIYESINPARRRQLHAAAVPLVEEAAVWAHLVAATDKVDPALANKLELAANETFAAGNVDQATTWMLWASDLSESREDNERRVLQAAYFLIAVISFSSRANELQPRIEACAPSSLRSAILGRLAFGRGECTAAEEHLTAAFEATVDIPELAAISRLSGSSLIYLYQWLNRNKEALAISRRVSSIDFPDIAHWKEYLHIIPYMKLEGPRAALARLAEMGILPARGNQAPPDTANLLMLRGTAHSLAGDLTHAAEDLTYALQISRPRMPTRHDVFAHYMLAHTYYMQGSWEDAARHTDYAVELMTAEKTVWYFAPTHMYAAMLAAGRGDWNTAAAHLQSSLQAGQAIDPSQLFYSTLAAASVAQARGDYTGMLEALRPALTLARDTQRSLEHGLLWYMQNLWRPLEVEALIGTGDLVQADETLTELRALAKGVPGLNLTVSWLSGWLAEARGDTTKARKIYQSALSAPAHPDEIALHRARLQHSYGQFLLSHRDRRAAGEALSVACGSYAALGARPFLERCDKDLQASGPQSPKGAPDPLMSLTDREREVVNLVKKGMTNAELAQELYLSIKTVEYHLSNVYAKYGVSSRKQLRYVLSRA